MQRCMTGFLKTYGPKCSPTRSGYNAQTNRYEHVTIGKGIEIAPSFWFVSTP